MNHNNWQEKGGHPPAALLLLHLERELDECDSEPVRVHLDACAECRATSQKLAQGMSQFVEFTDSVVIPIPSPRVRELEQRFAEAQNRRSLNPIGRALRRLIGGNQTRHVVFVAGAMACALIIYFIVSVSTPKQSVYASQLLSEARSVSDSLMTQSKVLNQKIRLKHGNLIIERVAHHGRHLPVETSEPNVDHDLQQALDLARINVTDPLSVSDFTDWRAAQSDQTDSVKETAQSLIIRIRVRGESITEASLTLSRSGLRPIARSVEFRSEAPIEINEESYSISDYTPSHSEASSASSSSSTTELANPAAEATQPSSLDLESSELSLREAFHSIGADLFASPQIWRADHTVFYHARPKTAAQQESIRQAAGRIAYVKESERFIAKESELAEPDQSTLEIAVSEPLGKALVRSLGSEHAATSFVASLESRSSRIQAEANALDELGRRYPIEVIKTLPPDLRKRVNALASVMLTSLQRDVANYVKSIAPALDDVAQAVNALPSAEDNDNLPGCLAWQQSASLATPQLRKLHDDISKMFLAQNRSTTSSASDEQLIADERSIRSFLELHLISTCELF